MGAVGAEPEVASRRVNRRRGTAELLGTDFRLWFKFEQTERPAAQIQQTTLAIWIGTFHTSDPLQDRLRFGTAIRKRRASPDCLPSTRSLQSSVTTVCRTRPVTSVRRLSPRDSGEAARRLPKDVQRLPCGKSRRKRRWAWECREIATGLSWDLDKSVSRKRRRCEYKAWKGGEEWPLMCEVGPQGAIPAGSPPRKDRRWPGADDSGGFRLEWQPSRQACSRLQRHVRRIRRKT